MAIINNAGFISALQKVVLDASNGAAAGRFFDLDDESNFRRFNGTEATSADNPGGIRGLGGNDTLESGTGSGRVFNGNTGNDVLRGSNYLRGGMGNDTVNGTGILNGNFGNDLVSSPGIASINGELGPSLLRGGKGDDTLVGTGIDDLIFIGDFGADLLIDAETYVLRYDTNPSTDIATADVIQDLSVNQRIVVAADFSLSDLSFEISDVVGVSGLTRSFIPDNRSDVIIKRTSTGEILGIVNNFGNGNTIRGITEITPLSDPALSIG